MNRAKVINMLNSLLKINNNRIERYKTVTNETEETDLKKLFSGFIQTSKRCKETLLNEVLSLGGTPQDATGTTGKFRKNRITLRQAFPRISRSTMINQCEKEEDAALTTYRQTLRNNLENITSDQHAFLTTQYSLISADLDKVKSIQHLAWLPV